ncbi:argininosuccinate synthase [Trichophyton rubrum D6]|uniref:Argininosuccinate synthase n=4 Tax=Trichophyton TaxID=5550 RepID=F2SD48_TRIRC|nr:argininosuccinate synthase [Trichophyton rubrum CBS 118892]EZF10598.1 argininosuccinate synthase [Trichophyton rubrum MR850]EZF37457.1 argininosuccinate synthase [Trichophyton rubrum CBS 100081]EZF48085.1 argininosuccinate synthase [Trichophyton rubrum CBS 288.86]EZF58749.1 argininosuccinate synthase [Trichophyton rubrum CBS 289.86]EZF69342.1 argininosuccinate synthase [Trichophyton soudanense CBS 452.61]EZF80016.1 argininosuccinate synthase [Trichophyton rubrum MR1448]EZF90681.1 arginino
MAQKEKVLLAYSGGLDTSCILAWLLEQGHEVVCFLADVGQAEDFKEAERKALAVGAKKLVVEDLKKEFVEDLCFKAIQCNAIWEDRYLLGTSLARPVIARAMMRVAQQEGCTAVSHGCTGKGNDQVRFELAFYAIQPSINVIAPWRMPEFYNRFAGRNDLIEYAQKFNIPVTSTKAKPWSMDENLAHCSYEAGILEDADHTPPDDMWKLTDDPRSAPDTPADLNIVFEKGIPVALIDPKTGNKTTGSLAIFSALNEIGRVHGIGRIDIVENRYIGLKSRGCYDSPAMTILRLAHLDLEGLVLDREVRLLRDQFVTITWSRILYNGLYFSPERKFIEQSITASQDDVNGQVRVRCFKGAVSVLGRSSETSKLYDPELSSMDSIDDFAPTDTTGFIATQAIRLKAYGKAEKAAGVDLTKA